MKAQSNSATSDQDVSSRDSVHPFRGIPYQSDGPTAVSTISCPDSKSFLPRLTTVMRKWLMRLSEVGS